MESMTHCFGVGAAACNSCKRRFSIQEAQADNVKRTFFVAPPAIRQVINEVVCEGYINDGKQGASNA